MPNPKRRHSSARTLNRRAHWKLKAVNLSVCPQCKTIRPPHQVCSACGFYNGIPVLKIKAPKEEKK